MQVDYDIFKAVHKEFAEHNFSEDEKIEVAEIYQKMRNDLNEVLVLNIARNSSLPASVIRSVLNACNKNTKEN